MNYLTLLQNAKNNISGFKEMYDKAVKDNDIDVNSGMHTVFSAVFVPLLFNAINNKSPQQLKQLFNFMEEMETCGDILVSEVCEFTILEELCDEY